MYGPKACKGLFFLNKRIITTKRKPHLHFCILSEDALVSVCTSKDVCENLPVQI